MSSQHPREKPCNLAQIELTNAIHNAIQKHALTDNEALRVVNGAASAWIGTLARDCIRIDRHPNDPDKPGGLA